jgi:hypothetical protein
MIEVDGAPIRRDNFQMRKLVPSNFRRIIRRYTTKHTSSVFYCVRSRWLLCCQALRSTDRRIEAGSYYARTCSWGVSDSRFCSWAVPFLRLPNGWKSVQPIMHAWCLSS